MKKILHKLLATSLIIGSSISANSQDVYFREGFEEGHTFETNTATITSRYATGSSSGTWYANGIVVTNGGTANNCSTVIPSIGVSHPRFRSSVPLPDTAYLVTPVLDFGIQNLNFINGRASRNLTIWKTTDTLATTTNWTLIAVLSSPAICELFTTVAVNDPNAKRLKLQSRGDSDIDSVWITSTSTIVPVRYTRFSAVEANGKIKLNWGIATEINTSRYVIERSVNGRIFSEAGSLTANQSESYNWIDNAPYNGTNYYRIKAIDKDGSAMFTGVLKVTTGRKSSELIIAPNPVRGNVINVQMSNYERGIYAINLYNAKGEKVYSSSINYTGGTASKSLLIPATTKPGVYNLQFLNGAALINKRIVIE